MRFAILDRDALRGETSDPNRVARIIVRNCHYGIQFELLGFSRWVGTRANRRWVPWAYAKSGLTRDFDLVTAWMARALSRKDAAEFMRIDWRTVEEADEPFLIMEGYLERTPKGRVSTPLAFDRLGLKSGR